MQGLNNTKTQNTIDGETKDIEGTSFTIPEGTAVNTVVTITATTAVVDGKYSTTTKTATVTVTDKIPVEITDVSAQYGTYNGSQQNGYQGTPQATPYNGSFKFQYTGRNGTSYNSDSAPVNAGSYTVTITLADESLYIGSLALDFTIERASITITADSKQADVGTAKPTLTYTVSGMASNDTLATEPTMTCYADMDTIGQYPITASGAAVPSGGNYNTEITYVPGTLTVTDPTIHVTGVTLNKTSTTLTVGGSERLTATVAPSNATDKSVTWASTNTAVATVDASGNVTAVSAGTATITVTAADGGKIATCTVTVNTPSGGGSNTSSGGSSSTSSTTLPVSTSTSTEGSTTTTETTAAPTATTSGGGKAAATVNTAMGNEIVKQAVTNKSEDVVIAPKITGSVTKTEVSISASTVGQIGSQTNANLTIATPVADVTIPNGGLGSLSSAGGTVTVTAEKVGNTVEISVTAGGKTVESIPGGVTVTVPVYDTTPGTVAVLIHEDGTREVVRKSVADDGTVTVPLDGSAKLEIVDNSKYFADVPSTSWAADAVAFASSHELFNGTGANQFSPDLPMSRGMLAVVLHNLENNPDQTLSGVFNDVDSDKWYAEGVAWAASKGIVDGYGNGQFGPDDNITREQLAVMLWRYAGSPAATDKELHFADTDKISSWALEAMRWAAENGIVNGKGNGILDPTGQATRAETAQMLKNFLEKQ